MLVRFIHPVGYPERAYVPGEIADLPESEAIRCLNAGFVVPHTEQKTETAMKRRASGR